MSPRVCRSSAEWAPRAAVVAALAVSLPASAWLTISVVASPQHSYLGFLTLLPLLAAIQALCALGAMLCGALWGASLFIIGAWGIGASIVLAPTAVGFITLTALPAVYASGSAWLTRRIGFSPFVLGVGWIGVELALTPLGLDRGLLAGTQGDSALMAYVGRALGYVLVAFLVAYVNALLVEFLRRVPLPCPSPFRRSAFRSRVAILKSQILGSLSLVSLEPSHPRAPPDFDRT